MRAKSRLNWHRVSTLAASVLVTAAGFLSFAPQPAAAAVGINEQVNFQGRLLTAAGAIAPDGFYNIEFKIYQDGDGCVPGGTSPCGGTLKWTEDWVYGGGSPDNRVKVVNGYFSVALGSVNPFGSSVDWNQSSLWLSINIGNTSAAATFGAAGGDGEMLPFKRLTSAVYALNAKSASSAATATTAANVPLSGLTAATGTNTIDSLNFAQTWNWSTATTQNPLAITANALTSGSAFTIQSSSTATTGSLLGVSSGSTSTFSSGGVLFSFSGAHGGNGVRISDATASGTALNISANSLTSGSGINLNSTSASLSGDLASITESGSNAAVTGNALKVGMTGAASTGTALNITQGGTGLALRVNDDGTYTDTTAFVVDANGNVGIGTIAPQNIGTGTTPGLTLTNGAWISGIDSLGTGFLNMFSVNTDNQIQAGGAIVVDGGILLPTDAGQVTFSDLPVDASAGPAGTPESYTMRVGTANALTVYGEADGSGGIQNVRVAIGSGITPSSTLDVVGTVEFSTFGTADTSTIVCRNSSNQLATCSTASGGYLVQVPATTAVNTITPTANGVTGLTVNGTSGTAATALNVIQTGSAYGLQVTGTGNFTAATINSTFSTAVATEKYGSFLGTSFLAADTGLKQGLRVNTSSGNTTGTLSNLIGGLFLTTSNGNGGTTASMDGLYLRNDVSTGSTATDSKVIHIYNSVNNGVLTNQYGLYIDALAAGSVNYAIYTAGTTPSLFGGAVTINTLGTTNNNSVLCRNTSNVISNCTSVGATTVPLSGLTAAIATNTIDNLNFAQTWNWSTLGAQNGLTINAQGQTTGSGLVVQTTSTTATGSILYAGSASAGAFIGGGVRFEFSGDHTNTGLLVTDVTTAGTAMQVVANSLTSGIGLSISSSNTATTGRLLNVSSASNGAFTNGGILFNFTGAHTGAGMLVNDSTQTGSAFGVNVNALTSGVGAFIGSTSTTTTGNLFQISSASNSAFGLGGVLFNFTGDHGGQGVLVRDFTTAGTALLVNTDSLTTGNALSVTSTSTTTTGKLLNVSSASTGAFTTGGVYFNFTGAHTNDGIREDDATATGTAMRINVNSLTSGNGLAIGSTNTATTGNLLSVSSASTSAFANGGVLFGFTGAHTGFGVRIGDATQTGTALRVDVDSLTSGSGVRISSANTTTTGQLLAITSSSTGAFTTGGVLFSFTGDHTGVGVQISDSSTAGTGLLLSSAATTGSVQTIIANALTSGTGLAVSSTGTGTTGMLLYATSASTSAFTNGGVHFSFTGAHTGNGVQIDDATVAGSAVAIAANSLTTGSGMALSVNSLTSGNGLAISSTSTGQTGSILSVASASTSTFANGGVQFSFTGAHTGTGVRIADATQTGFALGVRADSLTSGTGVLVISASTTATGPLLNTVSASTGLFSQGGVLFSFTGAHTGNGVVVSDVTQTGTAMGIAADSLTSGNGLTVTSASTTTTGTLLYASSASTAAFGNAGVWINFTGAHTGNGFLITDVTQTGNAANIVDNAITSGSILSVSSTSTTQTGTALSVSSASNAAFTNGGVNFLFSGNHTGGGVVVIDNTTAGGAMSVIANNLTTGNAVAISSSSTTATGKLLLMQSSSTGAYANGAVYLSFAGAHTGRGMQIDDVTQAGTAMGIDANSLTTGSGLAVSTSASAMTGKLVAIAGTNAGTGSTGALIDVSSASTGAFSDGGVSIDFTGAHTGDGMRIDDVTATGNAMNIVVNSLTSGNGLIVSSTNTTTTGAILAASSASTGTFADGGFSLNFTGAHTGDGVRVDDATQTGNAMNITANAVTSGSALVVSSTSTGLTGSLASFSVTGNNAAVTGNVLGLSMTGASTLGNTLKVDKAGTGGFALWVSSGAIKLGDASNNMSFDATNHEPTLAGTARHAKVATLTAEYPGSVLDASGSNNSGTVTAPYSTTAGFLEGYYNWTTATVTPAQTYDVVVNFPLPSDWSAWASSTPITVDTYSSVFTTSLVTGYITDTAGTAEAAWSAAYNCSLTPSASTTWQTKTGCAVAGTYAANGTMNMHFRLTAINGSSVRLGTIKLSYLSKF